MAGIAEVVLGGALAIGGGWFSAWQQGRVQSSERRQEHAERRRERRREKAELVFEELKTLVADYGQQAIYAIQLAGPAAEKPKPPSTPSAAMLDALVTIYFPECIPIVEAFHEEMKAATAAYVEELRGASDSGGEAIRGVHIVMTQDASQRAITFSERLRAAMKPQVDRLWEE